MKQKTKDNLIYIGVAGIILAALIFYISYTDRTLGRIPEIPAPILWGIISTPGIVALIMERYWEYRHRGSLWAVSIIAAFLNVSGMVIAYSFRWNPPVLVWFAITFLYVILLFVVAEKFVVRGHGA